MEEKVTKRETIKEVGNGVASAMHTALRKCCDSPTTSAAYSVIHLLDHAWGAYGRLVAERIIAGAEPLKAAREAIRDLHELAPRRSDYDLPKELVWLDWLKTPRGENERWSLYCVLRLIPDPEWEGIVSYLGGDYIAEIRAEGAVGELAAPRAAMMSDEDQKIGAMLDEATGLLNRRLVQFEAVIHAMGIRVRAEVPLDATFGLSYGKASNVWGLYVVHLESGERTPILKASRSLRAVAAGKLDALVEELRKRGREELQKVTDACAAIAAVLAVLPEEPPEHTPGSES